MLGESKAVFLSYASEDLAAAERVAAALQAAGIDVWLDKSELRGGDAWDSMIRGKIRGCALFMALISAHSRTRAEGYFRFEWKLAVDRSCHIASDRPFLLPVIVDETREADARVPDRFREVQWTHAPRGDLAQAFVARVRRMLKGTGATAGQTVPESAQWPASVPDKSLAVMPFANLNHDPENEYFSEGLAEEILTALTEIEELHVAARSSSFYFKGRATDLQEIARRLRVAHVLEGSVRRVANRVRVTVQLVDVRNGFQLWSERYDREMEDVFAIQDEITSAIVQHLKLKLLDEKDALVADAPVDLETYNLYLKGRFHWAQRPQGIAKAIEYFKQAIERDPDYARARAGLADCYVSLGAWESGTVPPLEAMPLALQAADKALELDSRLVEAHTSLAYRTTNYEWDWDKAEARFKHAFDLNPNYAVCHHWYSHFLVALGRTEESLRESKRCLELDPLDHITNAHLAWHHMFSRQFEEAVEQCVKTDEMHGETFIVSYFRGLAQEQLGTSTVRSRHCRWPSRWPATSPTRRPDWVTSMDATARSRKRGPYTTSRCQGEAGLCARLRFRDRLRRAGMEGSGLRVFIQSLRRAFRVDDVSEGRCPARPVARRRAVPGFAAALAIAALIRAVPVDWACLA